MPFLLEKESYSEGSNFPEYFEDDFTSEKTVSGIEGEFNRFNSGDFTLSWYPSLPLRHVGRAITSPGIYIIEKRKTRKGVKKWYPIYVGQAEHLRSRLLKHRNGLQQKQVSLSNYQVRMARINNISFLDFAEWFIIRTLTYYYRLILDKGAFSSRYKRSLSDLTNDRSFLSKRIHAVLPDIRLTRYVPEYLLQILNRLDEIDGTNIKKIGGGHYRFVRATEYETESHSQAHKYPLARKTQQAILKESKGKNQRSGMGWTLERESTAHQKHNIDAQLEDLGYAAAEASTEAEAEALVGAMVPLAAQLVHRVKPLMMESSPGMVAGLEAATKILHRDPSTRPLLRTMPTILHHTAAVLNRQMLNGRKPTPQGAVKVLANQAAKVIASPQQTRKALQHAKEFSHHH